jgi:hypothetical protein
MVDIVTYSPSQVTLVIDDYQLVGWDTISIAKTSPSFITIPGIRGKHTRVPNTDKSCTIQIGLIQTSKANSILSAVHALDIEQGTGKLSVMLKDNSGESVFSSSDAYIVSYPDVSFSAGFEYRQWNIFCQTVLDYKVGGNTRPKTILDSLFDSAASLF